MLPGTYVRTAEHRAKLSLVKKGTVAWIKHGHAARRGGAPSRTYRTWVNMLTRCTNPKVAAYHYYGARGISVCNRWVAFKNFLEDMGERPDDLTLDRIDNDGDYTPENCRWVTRAEQNENKRAWGAAS